MVEDRQYGQKNRGDPWIQGVLFPECQDQKGTDDGHQTGQSSKGEKLTDPGLRQDLVFPYIRIFFSMITGGVFSGHE